jgi:hypothetical protein
MHGGAYKLEKHGMYTLRAKAQRKQINAFLREVDEMNNQIDHLLAIQSPRLKSRGMGATAKAFAQGIIY